MSSSPLIFQSLLFFSYCSDDSINSCWIFCWISHFSSLIQFPLLIQCVTFFVIRNLLCLMQIASTPFFAYLLVTLVYTNTYISYLPFDFNFQFSFESSIVCGFGWSCPLVLGQGHEFLYLDKALCSH